MKRDSLETLGRLTAVAVCAATLLATACGGGQSNAQSSDNADSDTKTESSDSGTSTDGSDGSASSTSAGSATTTSSSSSSSTSSSGSGSTSSSGSSSASAPAVEEVAKDPSPLVLEIEFVMKGGGKVESEADIRSAGTEYIAQSKKLALPTTKNIEKPRRVQATCTVEPPIEDKGSLTVKMRLTGVEPDGQCPVFDLDQKFSMTGAKSTTPADVLALRQAGMKGLLKKLEEKSGDVKPAANCTSFKKKT